jgi:glycosyltransferase involved in cell wall biosynthesis
VSAGATSSTRTANSEMFMPAQLPFVSIVTITKNDPEVATTVAGLLAESRGYAGRSEIVVVDATPQTPHRVSDPAVRWIEFVPRAEKPTIPEQRNRAVAESAGAVIVFIDSGCVPEPGWLSRLVRPIHESGEQIVAGAHVASRAPSIRDHDLEFRRGAEYLREAPTINLAVRREVFDAVGGFDESFGYGSDVDFTWRAVTAGYQIRHEPSALVSHDWGAPQDDLRRSWVYGQARSRLYAKHATHRPRILKDDPVAVLYPAFLLALLAFRGDRRVLGAILIPVLKNARRRPLLTLAHNLAFGAGVLAGAGRTLAMRRPA